MSAQLQESAPSSPSHWLASAPSEVQAWVRSFTEKDAGPDLEYDNRYLELTCLADGKPETQFSDAVPPDWNGVVNLATELLSESRDLRIVTLWIEARLQTKGLSSLRHGLWLLAFMLDQSWDSLHPALDPDDGDAFGRANALDALTVAGRLHQTFRESQVCRDPLLGNLALRHFEYAMELAEPRPGEQRPVRAQLLAMMQTETGLECIDWLKDSLEAIRELQRVCSLKFPATDCPDLSNIRQGLELILSFCPSPVGADPAEAEAVAAVQSDTSARAVAGRIAQSGVISSRAEALRALDRVCDYLEKAEPTNPAQLLLRRAQRLIDKDFLQLVKDLAPDALRDVARIMGVDPDELNDSNY